MKAMAISPEALHLQQWLATMVVEHETRHQLRKRARRADALQNFERAIGAFVADLLAAQRDAPEVGLVYASRNSEAISRGPQTYDALITTFDAMCKRQLVEEFPGYFKEQHIDWGDGGGRTTFTDKKAARFRATPTLLALVEGMGISLGDLDAHFERPGSDRLLSLRAKSVWVGGDKLKGVVMPLPGTAEMKAQAARVASINDFFSDVEIRGGGHRTFFRGFAMGDQPGFAWDKGGRLYSEGADNYQQLPQARRVQMTLNGEPVVEIDIKASFLTILHGLTDTPLEMGEDAYAFAEQNRDIAKAWLTASLGSGRPITRWPKPVRDEYFAEHSVKLGSVHAVRSVAAAMQARFPILASLMTLGLGWADLMYVEAEAIIASLEELQAQGVPSLPVHDSLIVPASMEEKATKAIQAQYLRHAKIIPKVHVKRHLKRAATTPTPGGELPLLPPPPRGPGQQPPPERPPGQLVTIRAIYRRDHS
ncbi:MAG: hypothetical protein ACREEG_04310 [Phenylobacterium sp.]